MDRGPGIAEAFAKPCSEVLASPGPAGLLQMREIGRRTPSCGLFVYAQNISCEKKTLRPKIGASFKITLR